jgi:hypothetical protein
MALAIVLLPITGWAIRFVAFRTDGQVSDAARLAMSMPLPELAYLGGVTFLFTAATIGFVYWTSIRDAPHLLRIALAREHRDAQRDHLSMREMGLAADRSFALSHPGEDAEARVRETEALVELDRSNLAAAQ